MKSVIHIHCHECRPHLVAFLHGDVSPLLRRRIARHLDRCPACYHLYMRELDLMRDLKREVPQIGAMPLPNFEQVWAAIQHDIAQPRSTLPHFHMSYGLAMLALVLACLVPLTLGNQRLSLASPPPPPAPLVEQATPSSTAPGTVQTAAASLLPKDVSQATPEPLQHSIVPSLDLANTP